MNTDADPGEGVHPVGEVGLLGTRLQIRVHLCPSVVELLFLGSSVLSVVSELPDLGSDEPGGAAIPHRAARCAAP